MKKNRLTILVALLAAMPALQAAPIFQPSRTDVIRSASLDLLQNCTKLDFMFKECTWQPSYALNETGSITVPKGFRESPQTSIIVDGNFNKTSGEFRLSIDGVLHPLADMKGEQSFVLPNGTKNILKIAIISNFSGKQYAETDTTAVIRKVSLKLDNTVLVDSVLSSIQDQDDKVNADADNYRREKRFLRFFSQTDKEIGQIKFNLTGREANDLSDDCEKPDRLLPDECGYLLSFNRYLRGDKNEFTDVTKSKAFQRMMDSNAELGNQIDFLKKAGKEALDTILKTYDETLAYIAAENNLQTEE